MNSLLWIAQILLGGVFLYAGFSKILAHKKMTATLPTRPGFDFIDVPDGLAAAIAVVEIAGALCVLVPIDLWPPDVLVRLATAGLALVTVAAGIYHLRRQETAAPTVALFLLSLFIIVGRWPR